MRNKTYKKKSFKNYKKSLKNEKKKFNKKVKTYKGLDYNSNNGMLTAVWGPGMWFYLHTMSFNYPLNPTKKDKLNYKNFILNLRNVLPCGKCRKNFVKNLKAYPIKECHLKNRTNFSKYVYRLHEIINTMLGKKSNLSYCDVRDLYENFRARCASDKIYKLKDLKKISRETGCTEPLYGHKAKCVLKIVSQKDKCKTLQVDKKCIKKNLNKTKKIKNKK